MLCFIKYKTPSTMKTHHDVSLKRIKIGNRNNMIPLTVGQRCLNVKNCISGSVKYNVFIYLVTVHLPLLEWKPCEGRDSLFPALSREHVVGSSITMW